ncbi:MAG: lysine biosynthesis protein LysW [archaeon]
MVNCVECNAAVELPSDARQGEIVDCPECGIELEIVNPGTGEVRVAEATEEDWGE